MTPFLLIGIPFAALVSYGVARYAIDQTANAPTAIDSNGNPVANPNVQAISNAAMISILGISAALIYFHGKKK